MKKLHRLLFIAITSFSLFVVLSCNSNTQKESEENSHSGSFSYAPLYNELSQDEISTLNSSASTILLYFHTSRRCTTCKNVEINSGKVFYDLFKDQIELGEYIYVIVNLDDSNSKEIAQKYGVGGQALIIVKGDVIKSITAEAFLNSKNVNGLSDLIKKTIDSL